MCVGWGRGRGGGGERKTKKIGLHIRSMKPINHHIYLCSLCLFLSLVPSLACRHGHSMHPGICCFAGRTYSSLAHAVQNMCLLWHRRPSKRQSNHCHLNGWFLPFYAEHHLQTNRSLELNASEAPSGKGVRSSNHEG